VTFYSFSKGTRMMLRYDCELAETAKSSVFAIRRAHSL
jgi:hypothetical protein